MNAGRTTRPTICGNPSEITTEWLQSVLDHAGYDCELEGFEAERVGTGQVGQNVRFTLNLRRAGDAPATIVGKFASDDPTSRQTGIGLLNYLREVRFYQELRPTLDVQTPKVLFTDINEADHDFVLVMEDLAPAQQGDQLRGGDAEQARLGVRELARLHGPRWGDPSLTELEWLGGQDEEGAGPVRELWDTVFPGFEERYRQKMAPEHMELGRALGKRLDSYLLRRDVPRTVTHGDFRLDNLMFGGPYPVAVVDWQSPALGVGPADLAYFMGTTLEGPERRACEETLVREYHDLLLDYGVGGYSLDHCWQDYRRSSFAGLVMAVIASMIVGQTERGDEMFMAMARRSATMAMDLDGLGAL